MFCSPFVSTPEPSASPGLGAQETILPCYLFGLSGSAEMINSVHTVVHSGRGTWEAVLGLTQRRSKRVRAEWPVNNGLVFGELNKSFRRGAQVRELKLCM